MAKLYRDYLFDNSASVYSALLCKYINPYLNNYCQELLKLLPTHNRYWSWNGLVKYSKKDPNRNKYKLFGLKFKQHWYK